MTASTAFFVPVLTAAVLLSKVLAHLQIALLNGATLLVIGASLLVAATAGLAAALAPPVVRVTILAGCAVLLLDAMLPLRAMFEQLAHLSGQ